jgi:hypothetical protein
MAGAAATMAIVDMAAQIAVLENSDQTLLLTVDAPQKTAKRRKKPLVKMYTDGPANVCFCVRFA